MVSSTFSLSEIKSVRLGELVIKDFTMPSRLPVLYDEGGIISNLSTDSTLLASIYILLALLWRLLVVTDLSVVSTLI